MSEPDSTPPGNKGKNPVDEISGDEEKKLDKDSSDTVIHIPTLPSYEELGTWYELIACDPPARAKWTNEELGNLSQSRSLILPGVMTALGGLSLMAGLILSIQQARSDYQPSPNVTAMPTPTPPATKETDIGTVLVNLGLVVIALAALGTLYFAVKGMKNAHVTHHERLEKEIQDKKEARDEARGHIARYGQILSQLQGIAAKQGTSEAKITDNQDAFEAKITVSLTQVTNNINAINTAVGASTTTIMGTLDPKIKTLGTDTQTALGEINALQATIDKLQATIDRKFETFQSQLAHAAAQADAAADRTQVALTALATIPQDETEMARQMVARMKEQGPDKSSLFETQASAA